MQRLYEQFARTPGYNSEQNPFGGLELVIPEDFLGVRNFQCSDFSWVKDFDVDIFGG